MFNLYVNMLACVVLLLILLTDIDSCTTITTHDPNFVLSRGAFKKYVRSEGEGVRPKALCLIETGRLLEHI